MVHLKTGESTTGGISMQKTYTIDSSEYGKIPGLKITQEWNGFFLMENSECSLVVKGDIDQINGINPVNVWRVK